MQIHSEVSEVGAVRFPDQVGQRVYMRKFFPRHGLPDDLSPWQTTVDDMLADTPTDGPAYLMIDQGWVEADQTQRRPGLHVDGNWLEIGHRKTPEHGTGRLEMGGHRGNPRHTHGSATDWYTPEAIILASSVVGCRAVTGTFDGMIEEGGDCSALDVTGGEETIMQANIAYKGNVTMLHESIPLRERAYRTLVRLNVPLG